MKTLFDGPTLRDHGIARTTYANADWMAAAVACAVRESLRSRGSEVTGEAIRGIVQASVGDPKSPHCWGALVNHLVREGRLVDTGMMAKMKVPRSHARRTPVWRWA